jgi:hypothetical protein
MSLEVAGDLPCHFGDFLRDLLLRDENPEFWHGRHIKSAVIERLVASEFAALGGALLESRGKTRTGEG